MSNNVEDTYREELERLEKELREAPKKRAKVKALRNLLGMGKVYKYPKKEKENVQGN